MALLIILFFICYLAINCSGQDTITPNNPLKENQTRISMGESFALGFFSVGNTSTRYVGIWYNDISVFTVIWVANRDNPITDTSGELTIARDGNLVVSDGKNNTLWSSNIGMVARNSEELVSAVLLDSGNLVLRDGNETSLWESFDFPTNTFMPGMKMRLNLTTGIAWNLRSWKNDNDPGSGEFSLGIETKGPLAELVIWRGLERFWRSGSIWNGEMFSRLNQENDDEFVSYVTLMARGQEVYVTITVSDVSIKTRFVLTPSGRVQQLSWQGRLQRWDPLWWSLSKQCFSYNYCGAFGSCNITGDGRDCDCLEGYVPKDQGEWERGNHSSGCVRRRDSRCGEEGFFKVERTTLPDFPISAETSSIEECEAQCRSNCSCVAYSFANVTWSNSTCLIWDRDLIDVEGNPPRGQVLYLRLDRSELGTGGESSKKTILPIVLPVAAAFLCLVGILGYCLWKRMHKRPGSKEQQEIGTVNIASESKDAIASEVPLFQFHSIVKATNNFDTANKLGEGGFGPVYKGKLQDQNIAVKRLAESSNQGLIEMRNEVELIAKLQHKNLVRLLGWCIHKEEKMLIYEYLPNRSLDQFLYNSRQKAVLDWKLRFNIIDGIAQGLLYLHRYSRLKIIHRDLKASNILLDAEMNPKISDFGMARIFGGDQTEASTKRVVGTFGYMAPEYSLDGHFSEKSDVYSFGVLLIEIVSGTKNTGFFSSNSSDRLLGNAWHMLKEDRGIELLDPICRDSFDEQQVLKCIKVGLLCVQDDPYDRPTMNMVVSILGSDSTSLPEPKMPIFSTGSSFSNSIIDSNSINFETFGMQGPH